MSTEIKLLKDKLLLEKDPLIKAGILKKLHLEYEIQTKELAKFLKVSEPYISSMMRLLKLPELVIDGYHSKIIKLTHLLVLSRLDDPEEAKKAYEQVLIKNLSTAQTDDLVRSYKYSIGSEVGGRVSDEMIDKINQAVRKIDQKAVVRIIQTRIKAKIIIEKSGDMKSTSQLIEAISKLLDRQN